ncbi:hypothetical protein ACLOJK_005157 [Asimina triloba]
MIESFDTIVKGGVSTNEAPARVAEPTVGDYADPRGINMINTDEATIELEMVTEDATREVAGTNVKVVINKEGKDDFEPNNVSVVGEGAEEGLRELKNVKDMDFHLYRPDEASDPYALTVVGLEGVIPHTFEFSHVDCKLLRVGKLYYGAGAIFLLGHDWIRGVVGVFVPLRRSTMVEGMGHTTMPIPVDRSSRVPKELEARTVMERQVPLEDGLAIGGAVVPWQEFKMTSLRRGAMIMFKGCSLAGCEEPINLLSCESQRQENALEWQDGGVMPGSIYGLLVRAVSGGAILSTRVRGEAEERSKSSSYCESVSGNFERVAREDAALASEHARLWYDYYHETLVVAQEQENSIQELFIRLSGIEEKLGANELLYRGIVAILDSKRCNRRDVDDSLSSYQAELALNKIIYEAKLKQKDLVEKKHC